MIEHTLDTTRSILSIRLKGALEKSDFVGLAKEVDPYLQKTGELAGIVLEAPAFPGWEDLGALIAHFRFVKDHHKRIRKIALVTDSAMGKVGERLASHFVAAEIKNFPASALEAARQWVTSRP